MMLEQYLKPQFLVPIAIVIILIVLWMRSRKDDKKSLYDRLGGVYAISAVVNKFSDELINNPIVGRGSANEYLKNWHQDHLDRLAGLKFMRTLWLCAISGGPFTYVPTRAGKCPFSLEKAHDTLHISSAEFDEVARVLAKTLDDFNVPAVEKAEVLAVFAAHKTEVVAA